MFVGTINEDLRALINDAVKDWKVQDLYVGCSGNFTIERMLKDSGFRLHGNDVSLYTSTIGEYLVGRDMPVKVYDPEYTWLEPYMEPGIPKIATILLCTSLLDGYGRHEPFFTRRRKAYRDQWERIHAETCEKVSRGLEGLKLAEFWRGDCVEWAQTSPQDAAFISFPPTYCLGVDERILTADLRWARAVDLRVGDRLISFDENNGGTKRRRRWKWGTITKSFLTFADCVRVHLANGESVICTVDHPWLSDYGFSGPTRKWRRADSMEGFYALKVLDTWETASSYDAGWLAAIIDGEGTLNLAAEKANISIVQKEGTVAKAIMDRLANQGYEVQRHNGRTGDLTTTSIGGGFTETLKALGSLRPLRLLDKFQATDITCRAVHANRVLVESVEDIGKHPIQSITVDCATYIGEGYLMHNTGGYEKLYKAFNAVFEWQPPEYEIFDDDRLAVMVEAVKQKKHWIMAKDAPIPGLEDYEVGRVQTSLRSKPFIVYSNSSQRRITMPHQKTEPVPIPRFGPDDVMREDSVLGVAKMTQGQMNTLGSQYLNPGIAPASAGLCLAILVDGKLIGAVGLSKGRFGEGEAYMMTDFAIRPTRYKRLSKLVLAAALSIEVRRLFEQASNMRCPNIGTTAFTDKAVSMKYRGLFELHSRKENPARLNYVSQMGRWTLREGYQWWLNNHRK